MNQFFRLLPAAALALAALPSLTTAQEQTEENTRLIPSPQVAGAWTLQWTGRSGRTYFLQNSHDLKTWTYLEWRSFQRFCRRAIAWRLTQTPYRASHAPSL